MYVSNLKVWNFRKFGDGNEIYTAGIKRSPDLDLDFVEGLNLLVGENDSGKTTIVDAIKVVLKTKSTEWVRVEQDDFYKNCKRFRIEIIIRSLVPDEAKHFIEWLGVEKNKEIYEPFLRLVLDVSKNDEKIIPYEVKAGVDEEGSQMNAAAKEYLQTFYLKPLRDAEHELIPRKNSRLAQILKGHEAFKDKDENHYLKKVLDDTNISIEKYFEGKKYDTTTKRETDLDEDLNGKILRDKLNEYLAFFFDILDTKTANFTVTGKDLFNILESLKLTLNDEFAGLGSDNLLFIATELILLKRANWEGIRIGLIEEIESHLHPQAQLRVIKYLLGSSQEEGSKSQFIITSHSPNLASVVPLENICICKAGKAYPLHKRKSKLDENDYKFLERFLDVTKANLFFARGVIIVEGFAENILLPGIARRLDKDLIKFGVSIVNVGSTAFLRYAKIFIKSDNVAMNIPVSIITDLDLKPDEYKNRFKIKRVAKLKKNKILSSFSPDEITAYKLRREIKDSTDKVKTFFSNNWTLEYCIALCSGLRKEFFKAVILALKEQKENDGVKNLVKYDTIITNIDTEFANWTESEEQIAFQIYYDWIIRKEISKAIIAQQFSKLIEENNIDFSTGVDNIQYLIDAINHVTKN